MGRLVLRFCPDGEVAEWSIVPDSKSGVLQGTVGSNPTLSARPRTKPLIFKGFFFCSGGGVPFGMPHVKYPQDNLSRSYLNFQTKHLPAPRRRCIRSTPRATYPLSKWRHSEVAEWKAPTFG